MTRPTISPQAAAVLTAQIPPRLIKKLDADPTLADRWTWTATTVATDKGEVVTLAITDGVVGAVSCSCLLQPKCLHVAAVIAVLEPAAGIIEAAVVAAPEHTAAPSAAIDTRVARDALGVCAGVLVTGAEASGAFVQAELLRSIHGCRTAGLHRLAATQMRILRSIRELRADKAEFSLPILAADLRDALAIAYQLAHGAATPALVGTARRDYEPIGNLRLHGVFTEAVVARSGYAGAVTYLADDTGRLFTRSDIAPGDAGRAAGAYDAPANIGDAVLPHRELGRSGLFVGDATASADGRLGAGQKVRAVRAAEPSAWPAARFAQPLATQLARIATFDATAEELRPGGWDLAFVEGTIVGLGNLVLLDLGDRGIELVTSLDQRALVARDNLVVLGKATGLRVRVIGRVRLAAPRRLDLLALAPAADETRIVMPDAWHGRANVHYDRLSTPSQTSPSPGVATISQLPPDLLEPLRRRVERVVQGGLGTLPTHALPELERDAELLAERSLRTGADVLRDLAAVTGARRTIDRERFATAWLRAALYDDAARRRTSIASW
jgi:hypothetical protein